METNNMLYDALEKAAEARTIIGNLSDSLHIICAVREYLEKHPPTDPKDDIHPMLVKKLSQQSLVLCYMLRAEDRDYRQ